MAPAVFKTVIGRARRARGGFDSHTFPPCHRLTDRALPDPASRSAGLVRMAGSSELVVMTTNVRRFIKTGIAFLFVGLLIGAWMIGRRELGGTWPGPYLVSAHAHAVQLGFVMFLILGVALWLFPKAPRGDTRYRPERIAAAYWTLTIATAARIAGEVASSVAAPAWLGWVVFTAGAAQVVGFGIYFWTLWPRIRPVGSHLREAKGERF